MFVVTAADREVVYISSSSVSSPRLRVAGSMVAMVRVGRREEGGVLGLLFVCLTEVRCTVFRGTRHPYVAMGGFTAARLESSSKEMHCGTAVFEKVSYTGGKVPFFLQYWSLVSGGAFK